MTEPFEFDKRNVRRSFERAASTYDAAAVLQREVERRMFERLDYVKLAPNAVLDAGCGTGSGSRELARRYPDAQIVALDLAFTMLQAGRTPRSWLQGSASDAVQSSPYVETSSDCRSRAVAWT